MDSTSLLPVSSFPLFCRVICERGASNRRRGFFDASGIPSPEDTAFLDHGAFPHVHGSFHLRSRDPIREFLGPREGNLSSLKGGDTFPFGKRRE